MPNESVRNIEPGMPEGTNADLLSSSRSPRGSETGATADATGPVARASAAIESRKAKAAGRVHDLGDRIERKGRELESGNVLVRPIGHVLDRAGDAIEGGARYLASTRLRVMGDDVVDEIREHPFVTAGLAMGTGWLLGRAFGDEEDEDEAGQERSERERGARASEEGREERRERGSASAPSSMVDRLKGKAGDVLASGIAAFAAKQIRDRIAG